MTMTQTVEIPLDRRITLEVPREIQSRATVITFTPAPEKADLHECPLCAKYRDPTSGALIPNAETIAAIEETNKPSAKQFNSLEELLLDLRS